MKHIFIQWLLISEVIVVIGSERSAEVVAVLDQGQITDVVVFPTWDACSGKVFWKG